MLSLPDAFAPMGAYRQFMLYALVPHPTKAGKMQKFPVSPYTGEVVSAHDPAHWTDHATAYATLANNPGRFGGVAFVFTAADPFFFLDVDGALVDGQWSPRAQQLCGMLAGAAIEVSQSGTGLHVFGTTAPLVHGCRNAVERLEFYTSGRFVALTGTNAQGNAGTDCTAALAQIAGALFPFVAGQDVSGSFDLTTEPVPEWRGPVDDMDLIRRAKAAKSAASILGGRASFNDLWTANADVLAATYPDGEGGYNGSDVDAALASHLAFWTGRHGERILSLMRQSALVRDKWDREDYLPRTIAAICAKPGDVCRDQPVALPEHLQPAVAPAPPAAPIGMAPVPSTLPPSPTGDSPPGAPVMRAVGGSTFVGGPDAPSLFAGCVYIKDEGRVMVPKCGRLKESQFRVVFGGYTFAMDDMNQRTTRNAYEAFTESQLYRPPMADTVCFRPDLPAAYLVHDAGRVRVNIYEPVEVPRQQGDAAPFLEHLAKLVPDERDRVILMSYMAACVQHKGVKFQWAPLIQGVPGNGKTLLSRCVAEALGRRYVHWPKASKLTKEFNAWMVGKLLYAVEDIYTPHNRDEVFEELKPMITGGDGFEIEGKGVDQISMDICGNFMFNSNHKSGVRKQADDRRFAMFFTAQQEHGDLARDGMDGDYFPKLYTWLKEGGGYAIVTDLLMTYPIPAEFNPAGDCHRAPATSSTAEAIDSSMGSIEQHVFEAVAQDRPGFAGGWISSIQLGRLLDELKAGGRLPLNKRKDMLRHMGYTLHPVLDNGRVNNPVQPDGGKPQLFVTLMHTSRTLATPAEVAKAYTAAQSLTK